MNSVSKPLTLTFIVLLLSSLLVLTGASVNVQAVSKPSVPQFTVKLVDGSYDVPPYTTTTADPYTGEKTTITRPGHRIEHYVIEVTIKNQPFTPYTNANGHQCYLYYDVQVKAHFDENWRSFSSYYSVHSVPHTSLKETIVTLPLSEGGGFLGKPPSGGQLDFRMEAFIGYWRDPMPQESALGVREQILVREESSGWSSIQTITITYDSSPSTLPSQTVSPSSISPSDSNDSPQPQNPQQFILMVVVFFVCIIAVLLGVIVYLLKQRKTSFLQYAPEALGGKKLCLQITF